jgi:hypothetical protein
MTADIEPVEARDKRLNAFNDLFKDRRPELYALSGEDKSVDD